MLVTSRRCKSVPYPHRGDTGGAKQQPQGLRRIRGVLARRPQCQKAGETDERLFTVAAWRETPYFTEAEREQALAAIILMIAVTNLFNRLNASTKQQAGAW